MNETKRTFLQHEYIPLVKEIPATAIPKWGKMNAQQMLEHVSAFFKVSTQKIQFPLVTPVEDLPKYMAFLHSDKEFRENTAAPAHIVPVEPVPVRSASLEAAVSDLDQSVKAFFTFFEKDPLQKTQHPVFGDLNFEEWVLLHYKHVRHHLRQFAN